MAEHGGYRRPSNPAPVSGPGALSRRTDGTVPRMDVTGQSYGQAQAFREQQAAAPLSGPSTGATPATGGAAPPPGLGEPSAFPDQPVTAGADAGPGPSAADIGLRPPGQDAELREKLGPMLPVFVRMADSSLSTPAFRDQVRELIARIS